MGPNQALEPEVGVLDDLGLVEGAAGMNQRRAETSGARPEPDAAMP